MVYMSHILFSFIYFLRIIGLTYSRSLLSFIELHIWDKALISVVLLTFLPHRVYAMVLLFIHTSNSDFIRTFNYGDAFDVNTPTILIYIDEQICTTQEHDLPPVSLENCTIIIPINQDISIISLLQTIGLRFQNHFVLITLRTVNNI